MRSQRQRARVATAFVLGAVLVVGTTALPNGSALASEVNVGETITLQSGDGSVNDPYYYIITGIDCSAVQALDGIHFRSIDPGVDKAYYAIEIVSDCIFNGPIPLSPSRMGEVGDLEFPGTQPPPFFYAYFQWTEGGPLSGIGLTYAQTDAPPSQFFWVIGAVPSAPALEQAPDSTVSSVAMAVAQAAAVGVEGTSSAVLIRNDEVVPVVSRVLPSVGPRGGVALDAEGLRATVASASGARVETGVVVSPSGDLEVSVVSGLVPGAVVEVWVNSSPRLVAAARVPGDHAEGDALTLTVPLGAPLDGGEPIEAGAHTLQIRMFTDAGFEVLATGITVGGVVPAGVPAGEGPVRLDGVLFALLGAAGLVGLAVRRTVVSG